MRYENTVRGRFLSRPNRFIAQVELEGREITVHVKNTGRCRELLLPGSEVVLEMSDAPARKTPGDLIAVYKSGLGWVNIDSQAPNQVVYEWLKSGPAEFPNIGYLKPEQVFGESRIDFYLECGGNDALNEPPRRILIEVKGCTLERDGVGYFPDAPTLRGARHLRELAGAAAQGYECYIAFVIAMPGVSMVLPNKETDPAFEQALREAREQGVKVIYLTCDVSPDSLEISGCRIE